MSVNRPYCEPGKAFAKMRFSGLHQAPLLGIPASGRQVSWAGAALFHFADGKIASLWVVGDLDGLRAQLAPQQRD